MPTEPRLPAHFRPLADAAVEGRLTPGQATELERLVLTDPAVRTPFVQYVSMTAALRDVLDTPAPPVVNAPAPRRRTVALVATVSTLAAGLALVLFGLSREPRELARIIEIKSCRWDSGTLPTEPGVPLGPGRLRLTEGLARLEFASGAEVTLEGPADLELVTPMKCVLRSGQLAAKIPPSANGFVVETPSSVLTDLGTEFGVKVHNGSTSDVTVFSGRVDVTHRESGAVREMYTGANVRFTPDVVRPLNPDTDTKADSPAAAKFAAGTRLLHLTTAQGKGRDAFVMAMDTIPADRQSDTLLLVKRNHPSQAQWDRLAYLGFDLAPARGQRVLDAELTLTFAPTGMGFAALCPDATFSVYGLTEDAHDSWEESHLKWDTAPANLGKQRGLDPAKATKLGTFVIPQGTQSGAYSVSGERLASFLRGDTNRAATFVIARDTIGTGGMDLVHGVVSRRHPTLPPPTLRLTLDAR
jgi:anti-sigma factor RsiW